MDVWSRTGIVNEYTPRPSTFSKNWIMNAADCLVISSLAVQIPPGKQSVSTTFFSFFSHAQAFLRAICTMIIYSATRPLRPRYHDSLSLSVSVTACLSPTPLSFPSISNGRFEKVEIIVHVKGKLYTRANLNGKLPCVRYVKSVYVSET